jgi:uncharacterized protein
MKKWFIIALFLALIVIIVNIYYKIKDKKKVAESKFEPEKKPVFNCTQCGNCCRIVKYVLLNKGTFKNSGYEQLIDEFPYTFKENGECEKLVNNKCSVYHNRPDLCNIDKTWERAFKNKMTLKEYHNLNYKMCDQSHKFIEQFIKNK